MSDFKDVMSEYWKQVAKKKENKDIKAKRFEEIYGGYGTKIECSEILEAFKSGGIIADVRNPVDYINGALHNSINVPHQHAIKWFLTNDQISKSTPILLYCDNGSLAESVMHDLQTSLHYTNVINIGSQKWYPSCS